MEAGVAAKLGFDQAGIGMESWARDFPLWRAVGSQKMSPARVTPHRGRWSRSRPGEVGELDAESGGGGGEDVAGGVVSSVGRGRNWVGALRMRPARGFDCPEGPTPIATTPGCWAIASRIWSRMAAMT